MKTRGATLSIQNINVLILINNKTTEDYSIINKNIKDNLTNIISHVMILFLLG